MRAIIAIAGLFALGLVWQPSTAVAASARDRSAGIEEVIVTARRREETAQSVPIPITALSADQLASRGITEIKNIENITPNLSFLNSAVARGTAQVFLRGIGQINWGPTQDPKVGIYVDGVYLGRPQGAIFDLLDIERVEVLRGPQGTLFGRNTTAGLVHVITKKPDSTFDAKISGGFGNDGQLNGDALVNVPLIDNVLAARFALQARKDDGFVKDLSGRDWNSTDSQSFRGTLLWTPTDTLDVSFAAEAFRARETSGLGDCEEVLGAGGLNFITSIFGAFDDLERACAADDDPFTSNDNDENGLDIDSYAGALTVNWDLDAVSLTSITAYREMKELNESWGWGTDFRGGPSFSLEVLQDQDSPYNQWSQEFRIEGNAFNDRVTWITGLYGFRESATQRINVPAWRDLGVPPPTPADAPLYYTPCSAFGIPGCNTLGELAVATQNAVSRRQETHATNKSWAAFAEATLDVTDAFSVTAGWRWTRDSREFKRYQFGSDFSFDPGNFCPGMPLDANGLATRSSCTQKVEYNETTPRIIFNYDINDDVMVYASYSRGYSAGGMNGDIRMRPFLPEVSDNFEAGMKSQWFDRRLQANVTVFQTDYENQQVTVGRLVRGQPTADLINAQEATIEGLEVEILATPWDGWYFTGSFGYLDGEYDEFSTVDTTFDPVTLEETEFINDFSDTEFVGGAPVTYSVSVAHEMYTDNAGTFTAHTGWSFRGRTYNTLERRTRSRQGKYGLLDARLTWELPNGNTSISAWGTNLLDREYYRAAQDLPDLGVLLKYYSEPRRYGVTLTHNFGG